MPSTTVTTSYQKGDLLLIDFPFATGTRSKTRPAMVMLDAGDSDVVVARVTSQNARTADDVPLSEWKGAGLLNASVVRLNKLVTLE